MFTTPKIPEKFWHSFASAQIFVRRIWFGTKLFFSTTIEITRFVAILGCGAGLGFSGEYIARHGISIETTQGVAIITILGFSSILVLIFFYGSVSKHIKAESMKEKIRRYETPPTVVREQPPDDQTYFPKNPD